MEKIRRDRAAMNPFFSAHFFAAMFREAAPSPLHQVRIDMTFQAPLLPAVPDLPNVPSRRPMAMAPQPLVAWTPSRLAQAAVAWVMAETPIPAPAPAVARSTARRA
jgi:hypothetical protein